MPVVRWLRLGAATAGIGIALAASPVTALADDAPGGPTSDSAASSATASPDRATESGDSGPATDTNEPDTDTGEPDTETPDTDTDTDTDTDGEPDPDEVESQDDLDGDGVAAEVGVEAQVAEDTEGETEQLPEISVADRTPEDPAPQGHAGHAPSGAASVVAEVDADAVHRVEQAATVDNGVAAQEAADSTADRVRSATGLAAVAPDLAPVALGSTQRAATVAVTSRTCGACWGVGASSPGQAFTIVVNHLFNNAFNGLSDLPANPISGFVEGALVLIRRTLFAGVSTGVVATQAVTELVISVNSGSVAYLRTDGTIIEVSGNPLFSGAQQFVTASVADVDVTGTSGCAGFVFVDGALDANLDTSQIDSIEFENSAAFVKNVRSTLTSGSLWLSDAVRGLTGVTFDGAIRLRGNTEIDAGVGNATFNSTVDGRLWGRQSLTVTALGTTTFDAAVGDRTALASLVTRGIAPLRIDQSADSKTIPLHYMPEYSTNGNVQVKYGIDVAIGNNPSQLYEFDTGGPGFFAGYSPDFWKGVTLGTDQVDVVYTSGNYYNSVVTTTSITIGKGTKAVTTQPIQLGAILQGGNKNTGATFEFSDPFAPPVDGRFFGDFGASFGLAPIFGTTEALASALFQLPGNLSSGYLAQLGPIGEQPQLTVGVTDALRAQFPYAVPVFPAIGGTYPVSGYPVLEAFGFTPEYTATGEPSGIELPLGTTTWPGCSGPCLPTIIDSGAPSTNVRLPDVFKPYSQDGALKPGTTFTATFPTTEGREPLIWSFVAGTNGSVDEVNYSNQSGAAFAGQNLNTGLNLYNGYDVMFDVAEGVIWLRPNGGQANVIFKSSVNTRGEQSYGQNAVLSGTYSTGGRAFSVAGVTTLAGDTVIDAGRGHVTFSGTVDGGFTLDVKSRGTTTFVRAVGSLTTLKGLTTDAVGSTATAGVNTNGTQSYGDEVSLNGQYVVDGDGTFSVAQSTTLSGPVAVMTDGGTITFGGRIDSLLGKGFPLTLSAGAGQVHLNGRIGSKQALGGVAVETASEVTADERVILDGSLGYAAADGLSIGDGVTAKFASGGSIRGFTGSGVVFQGASRDSEIRGFTIADNVNQGIQLAAEASTAPVDYSGTVIAGNTIFGNSAFGIETSSPVTNLTISGNTIGAAGTSNPWNYVTSGPNTHGIVLAPGDSSGTQIFGNTIAFNLSNGITSSAGVQGVWISGNTIENNGLNGIAFTTGDFTGTTITGNTIRSNSVDGISLGAGIGQGTKTGGDPLAGYAAGLGHYVVKYANDPDFYDPGTPAVDPRIALQVGANELTVNLDTGSRGLYFDILQLEPTISLDDATLGHIYLNSSNRLFFGQWTTQTITFTQSEYSGPEQKGPATATVPILAVTAIGASTTPAPGSTVASTTFGTTVASGTVTITNGTKTAEVPIVPNTTGTAAPGIITIPGGWYANYADNMLTATTSKLASVANFGVGFDRTGQGTMPTANDLNQAYNAFLNLTEMQDGTMRPGYVISAEGVQLGLDSSVSGFAYTDLAPTGLAQGSQSAPDWQPGTGAVKYDGTASDTGQIVLDLGIASAILTLPGQSPSSQFSGQMTVDLLNSGGAVHYDINLANPNNLLNPTNVEFFDPLAGRFTENMPAQNQQFFNTGRNVISAFDYLYDAASGYFGLKIGATQEAQQAFEGHGQFAAAFYANPNQADGVSNLTITGNTITSNGGNGVTVNGQGSAGNAILSTVMHSNAGAGIALQGGANGDQPAPTQVQAKLANQKISVKGTVTAVGSYTGEFQVQVYASPASDAGSVQGRRLLGSIITSAGDFVQQFAAGTTVAGDWITMTVTPVNGPRNSSEFSSAAAITL